eukprot:jgi/Chrzof1/14318/UNPLg00590.t1
MDAVKAAAAVSHLEDTQPGGAERDDNGKCSPTDSGTLDDLHNNLTAVALFGEEDDEDDDLLHQLNSQRPWYRRPRNIAWLCAFGVGVLLVLAGLLLQLLPKENDVQAFRWTYFIALCPVLWFIISWIVNKAFLLVEWIHFKEIIYYWSSLKYSTSLLAFSLLLLAWFALIFNVFWCTSDRCTRDASYVKAANITWNILLCIMLFALANFIKSLLAKLLSSHFYHTAHMKKVKAAVDKEYYLLMLSTPRAALSANRTLGSLLFTPGALDMPAGPTTSLAYPYAPGGVARPDVAPPHTTVVCHSSSNGDDDDQLLPTSLQRSATLKHQNIIKQHRLVSMLRQRHTSSHDGAGSPRETQSQTHSSSDQVSAATPSMQSPKLQLLQQKLTETVQLSLASQTTVRGQAAGTGTGGDSNAPSAVSNQDINRMREALAVKTFSALLRKYHSMNETEETAQLKQAKRFAKGLFFNTKADADRSVVVAADFADFFPDEATATAAFAWFDKDGDGGVSASEMVDSVTDIVAERKNMAASLKDTDSIVGSLELGLGTLVHFVFIAFYLLVWDVNVMQGFSTLSATVLALTFVFGESVKSVYDNSLFLFVAHPFDVGDALWLDNSQWRVKKIGLMTTELLKSNGDAVYYPNNRLRSAALTNLTRSSKRSDTVSFLVDMDTCRDLRDQMLECINLHVQNNSSEFSGKPFAVLKDINEPFKLRLMVGWTYNFSGAAAIEDSPVAYANYYTTNCSMVPITQPKTSTNK